MRYSFRRRGNRRLYLLYLMLGLLLGATLLPPLLFPGLLSLGIALVAGYLFYQIFRFLQRHLKSYVLTHDDGVTFLFPSGELARLAWEELTHAGIIRAPDGTQHIFIYAEERDQLATVPKEYDNLDELARDLKARAPWYELEQAEGQSLGETVLPLTKHGAENTAANSNPELEKD